MSKNRGKERRIYKWPKENTEWIKERKLFVSIPFTWLMKKTFNQLKQKSFMWDSVTVGGPAVELMPGYFDKLEHVTEGHDCDGVLQRVNPLATRTTVGCIRRCGFCAIGTGRIEGAFRELEDWPDLPMITDNNLLAASDRHYNRVIDRLVKHGWADFNQGLDSRLLTDHHAKRLAEIKKPTVRLALDNLDYREQWTVAYDRLRGAGIAKSNISSYCLVGFKSGPRECWQRCEWVQSHGVKAYPMWFHGLNQEEKNIVTGRQIDLGWSDHGRKEIMGYYYKHRGHVPGVYRGGVSIKI